MVNNLKFTLCYSVSSVVNLDTPSGDSKAFVRGEVRLCPAESDGLPGFICVFVHIFAGNFPVLMPVASWRAKGL